MAKTRIIKPEELTSDIYFRIEIVNWNKYQKAFKGESEGEDQRSLRSFVKLCVMLPSDTMLKENLLVRGLFWEFLRYSGASRRPGWVVAGNNEPLCLDDLAYYLRLKVDEIVEPLKRLMKTGRVFVRLAAPPSAEDEEQKDANEDEKLREITSKHEDSQADLSHKRRREKKRKGKRGKEKRESKEIEAVRMAAAPRDSAATAQPTSQKVRDPILSVISPRLEEAFPEEYMRLLRDIGKIRNHRGENFVLTMWEKANDAHHFVEAMKDELRKIDEEKR